MFELRRRIDGAQYGVISKEDCEVEDDFTLVDQVKVASNSVIIPRVQKFLALDIMSARNSWGDDAFALVRMPPEWWTWLQKRREQGLCGEPNIDIILD